MNIKEIAFEFRCRGNYRLVDFMILLFIAACSSKIFYMIHHEQFDTFADAAYGVILGKPHWVAYQNRFLAPLATYLITYAGFDYLTATFIFYNTCIFILAFVLYYLIFDIVRERLFALLYLIAFFFVFMAYQHYWFYVWDAVDIIVFSLFAFGIIKNRTAGYFVLLFFVSIFNRESAMFIALYIIVSSFEYHNKRPYIVLIKKYKLMLGLFLLICGAVFVKLLRSLYFISQPNGFNDDAHQTFGNHFYILGNLKSLLWSNLTNANILNTLFLLVPFLYFFKCVKLYNQNQYELLLLIASVGSSILLFGFLNESRNLLVLIPMYLALWLSVQNNR